MTTEILFTTNQRSKLVQKLKNAWIQQMGSSEWDFFTADQNPCGELTDPDNAKLACKLRHGTAFCRVKCAVGFMPKNTKEKSQWCRNGRWMPRKTPTCVRGLVNFCLLLELDLI